MHANKILELTQEKNLFLAIMATKDFIPHPTETGTRIHTNKILELTHGKDLLLAKVTLYTIKIVMIKI